MQLYCKSLSRLFRPWMGYACSAAHALMCERLELSAPLLMRCCRASLQCCSAYHRHQGCCISSKRYIDTARAASFLLARCMPRGLEQKTFMDPASREAGARVLAFLAGPPDYGRGAVLRPASRPLPSAASGPPLFDPTFPDVNPYAFVPLSAASGRGTGGEDAVPDDGNGGASQVRRRSEHGMCTSPPLSAASAAAATAPEESGGGGAMVHGARTRPGHVVSSREAGCTVRSQKGSRDLLP